MYNVFLETKMDAQLKANIVTINDIFPLMMLSALVCLIR